ncbi:DNA-directed RNA polymerase, partial [Campylobacter lanienae]|uniref:DNA-directed RNA polymerase n=1 Tax=Campylobacter lanienae TaxID=75658 RepID=UPI0021C2384E
QSGHCPNPQGMGVSKALLKFAEGKAIGSKGGKWLSLHGANAFGDDKLSLDARFKWAYEREQDIVAVAQDPYANKWWWDSDDPWKFLAFCYEWYG